MTTPWSWQQFLEACLPHTRALDRGDMPPRKAPNDAANMIARQIQRETNKPDVPPADAA
jgi:hypothetical protein